MFDKFPVQPGDREIGTVNWNVYLPQQKRNRSNMIFVAVSQDQRGDLVPILINKGEIRYDYVDPVDIVLRESHACVNDDRFAATAHRHHVQSKFANTAQRNYFQFVISHKI